MHRIRPVMCLIVVLLLATAVHAQTEEDLLSLTFLEPGVAIEAELTAQYDSQLFAFTAAEGDVITLSVTQPEGSSLDPYAVLLGNRGEILAADDDSGEDVLFSARIADYEIPAEGTYFLLVTTFLGTSMPLSETETVGEGETLEDLALPYTVLLEGSTTPAVEQFQYASGDAVVGESVMLTVTPQEPIFYVDLDVVDAGNYDFTLTSEPLDPLIMVFDGLGRRIAINDDSDGLNAALEGLALEPGRYLIMATVAGYEDIPDNTSFEGGEVELLVAAGQGSSK